MSYCIYQGFWYFAEKKARFRRISRGKFEEKPADFAGFSQGKSQNSWRNRPISRDFRGKKVKISGTIGRFRGILAEKSQFSKDFQEHILRKIGRFHRKFRGGNFAKKQSVKISRFRWIFFWQISLKSINFASIWPALVNVFLTGIIICSFNNSALEKWANVIAINIMVSAQFFATFI